MSVCRCTRSFLYRLGDGPALFKRLLTDMFGKLLLVCFAVLKIFTSKYDQATLVCLYVRCFILFFPIAGVVARLYSNALQQTSLVTRLSLGTQSFVNLRANTIR